MSSGEGRRTRRRGAQSVPGGSDGKLGAWLDWAIVLILCQLDLRPPSLWQVFITVLFTSARYGGREARLSIDDLSRITGLAPRTVKGAVSTLMTRKLLIRIGRYGCFRVNFSAAATGGAYKLTPPVVDREIGRGADKLAPPRGKLVCTSPTSIYVSLLSKEISQSPPFTARQLSVIADIFAEATELLGSDSAMLSVPDTVAATMGLAPPISYGEAFEVVARSGDRRKARDYTRAVLALRRDERIQGQELNRATSCDPGRKGKPASQ